MILNFGSIAGLTYPVRAANDASTQRAATGSLKVKVMGLKTDRGSVAFALFGSRETYQAMDNPLRGRLVKVRDGKCEWTVENVPAGEYAVALYHDRNDNGKLDTVFWFPAEPYGFSNNARALTSAPLFRDTKFVVDGDTVIEVEVR